jgi:hypothetical protein
MFATLNAEDKKIWKASMEGLAQLQSKCGIDKITLLAEVGRELTLTNMPSNRCSECHAKWPKFGMPGGKFKPIWCAQCAKAHEGAVNLCGKRCEDCRETRVCYGLPAEKKMRWCSPCGQAHAGARNLMNKKCETCKEKASCYGLTSDNVRRWCTTCAQQHAGAADLRSGKKCEDCLEKTPFFGLEVRPPSPPPSPRPGLCSAGCRTGPCSGHPHSRCALGSSRSFTASPPSRAEGPRRVQVDGKPVGKKRRWCGGCAAYHKGAVDRYPRCATGRSRGSANTALLLLSPGTPSFES